MMRERERFFHASSITLQALWISDFRGAEVACVVKFVDEICNKYVGFLGNWRLDWALVSEPGKSSVS